MPEEELLSHLNLLEQRYIVRRHESFGQVSYSLANGAISDMLVMLRWYFEQHLTDALQMLDEISRGEDTEEARHLRDVLAQLKQQVHEPGSRSQPH
jgi:hypothetical protein